MMDKKLQDLAWSILPKEFKEEVKNEYKGTLDNAPWEMPAKGYIRGRLRMMRELFGEHNLTSDAEGEEILYMSRKQVQEMYSAFEEFKNKDNTCFNLETLFGSKCLPDEKGIDLQNSKFKAGDIVITDYSSNIYRVIKVFENPWGYTYRLENMRGRIHEKYLRFVASSIN